MVIFCITCFDWLIDLLTVSQTTDPDLLWWIGLLELTSSYFSILGRYIMSCILNTTHSGLRLPWWLSGNESICNVGDLSLVPGLGRSLDKEMAAHSSILAWETPWIEEPGGLQSMGSQKVRHDLETKQQLWSQVFTYTVPSCNVFHLPNPLSSCRS